MGRSQVALRTATLEDASFLQDLWSLSLRRAETEQQLADVVALISGEEAGGVDIGCAQPLRRIVLAEHDGQPVGAVLLQVGTVSPLNLEPVVQVLSPTVVAAKRRLGVGRALIEAGLAFAEEQGVATVATAVSSGARESNRFMARLALSPLATYRAAPTSAVRARLRGQRPPLGAVGARGTNGGKVTRVVAARRSMRRSRAVS